MNLARAWSWKDGLWLVVLSGLAVAAAWPAWRDIYQIAMTDEESSYIILVPFVAFWLFWLRRDRLRYRKPEWSLAGLLIIAAGWALSVLGFRNGIDLAWHAGALITLIGAAYTILGGRFIRAYASVMVALFFLLPLPGSIRQEIAIPLQNLSAKCVEQILILFNVPIVRNGNILQIHGYDVAVAEACNGMRMVAALGLVTLAFVFSVPMRQRFRIAFLAVSPVVALVVNIIRLLPTVLFYGYANKSLADDVHDASGWIMLVVAVGILWSMLLMLRWLEISVAPFAVGGEG